MATTSTFSNLASTICQTKYHNIITNNTIQYQAQSLNAQSLRYSAQKLGYQDFGNNENEIWDWYKQERDRIAQREAARRTKTFEDYL